jgi:hypothetical protein
MSQDTHASNVVRLYALLVPAAAYLAWTMWWPTLTGIALLDGSIGVILGLYICSHPAANGIDLFFLQRATRRRFTSHWSGLAWLLLNALVMVIGCLVIVVGAARFTQPHTFQT